MARYENTSIYKEKKTHTDKYGTTTYNKVPEDNSDMYFIAQGGDRCDILAQRFYGNPQLWYFIANANGLFSMTIDAGTSLRIPGAPSSLGI